MKFINSIKKLLAKNLSRISESMFISDIETAQRKLAFTDAQEFIYENSGIRTLSYSGKNAVAELHRDCIKNIPKSGEILEFGVYKGQSINFFAKELIKLEDRRQIIGFDSWQGFSEEWSGVNQAFSIDVFAQEERRPRVEKNVCLIDGFIEDTLPKFVLNTNLESIAFVHIDTDTYSPAKVVLNHLKPYFKSGTIVLFDELCGYPNWRSHEFKALSEELDSSDYDFLGFAHNGPKAFLIKAAIQIK